MKRLLSFVIFVSACAGCVHTTAPAMTPAVAGSCRSEALRWFAPEREEDRARLDAWCAGVGGPVLQSAAVADIAGPIDLADVTFVSWNVHVGNGDIPAFVRDLRAGVLTKGRPVRHFVLMLQEAVRTAGVPPLSAEAAGAQRIAARAAGRSKRTDPTYGEPNYVGPILSDGPESIDIVEISRDLGTHLLYVPSMRNGNSPDEAAADRGSAILSTVLLSDPVAVELPGERQRRVAIVAKLSVPSSSASQVSVGVVHLDALGAPSRFWLFGTSWMRELQVKSMGSLLPPGNLVLGADLNTWHGTSEPAVRHLAQLFAGTPVSFNRDGLGFRVLDYMFFRAEPHRTAHYEVVTNAYGSDHRPLVGWIE